jgi:carbonic anhydrase
VPIELIFNEGPNDLFVLRVAGNGLGSDVLGSLKYAINHLGDSLRLIVVLGHSGCGAVTTAVDMFLDPARYLSLATEHSLRNIIDHILGVVQASSIHLHAAFGSGIGQHPNYRQALIDVAIATHAALAAFSIEQELGPQERQKLRVVYGVYLLESRKIWAPGASNADESSLAAPPCSAAKFNEYSNAVIRSDRIRGLLS